MTKKEYLDQIADLSVNETKLKKIHETYSDQLPDDLEKIISNCDETVFFGIFTLNSGIKALFRFRIVEIMILSSMISSIRYGLSLILLMRRFSRNVHL